MPPSILDAIEHDASPEAARLFTDLATAYLAGTRAGAGSVSNPLTPGEIAARFSEPIPDDPHSLTEVVERLGRDVVAGANRLSHPMYLGHQVSAPLPAAVWSECVTAVINNSMAVAEMSPSATPLERQVMRWMCDVAGFGREAGGTLTSGGTEATFAALLAARSYAIPDVWQEGVGANPPVIVCGEHAHYAVTRAAGEMGLGLRSVITVASRDYRMDSVALAAQLDQLAAAGTRVMAVVATAGSTATGSFDDLAAIADLCDARGLWLHVDGAHGASALLSPEHREQLRGIDRARSLAWDPHKMMLLPLSAGMVLVRDERDLERAFAQQAPYLFQPSQEVSTEEVSTEEVSTEEVSTEEVSTEEVSTEEVSTEDALTATNMERERDRNWDAGVRSFQCSRRADAIKLWVALQRYGATGLGALYAHLCHTARGLHEQIAARADFEALHAPESNILCFRWTGARARREHGASLGTAAVDHVNRETRARYNRSGAGWITATVLGGRPVLRVTVMNPRTTGEHTARLLDGLAGVAERVAAEVRD